MPEAAQTENTEEDNISAPPSDHTAEPVVAPSARPEGEAQPAPEPTSEAAAVSPPKKESRLRAFFRRRRSSAAQRPVETASEERAEGAPRRSEAAAEARRDTDEPLHDDDGRKAPLASNPLRKSELEEPGHGNHHHHRNSHIFHTLKKRAFTNGDTRQSRKDIHENGTHTGPSESAEGTTRDTSHASTAEQETLRESAIQQGLPAPPPIGTSVGAGSARGSRFSEEL